MNDDGLASGASMPGETVEESVPVGSARQVRVAIVTPYLHETDKVLSTCLESVRDQTHPACRHFVISDGFPNPLVDNFAVTHIRLPYAHGDNGNFARCLGALAAVAEGFDAVTFLDADNWYQPDHIARMVSLQARTGVALCTSGRSIHRLDGTFLRDDTDGNGSKFVDTSCLFFFQPAFDLLEIWGAMPKVAGPIGDRLIWRAVKLRGVSHLHDPAPGVAFRSQYENHYTSAGEVPPKGAKTGRDLAKAWAKFRAIPYAQRMGMFLGIGSAEVLRPSQGPPPAQATQVRNLSVRGIARTLRLEVPRDNGTRFLERGNFEAQQYRPVPGLSPPRAVLDIGAGVGLAAAHFRLVYPEAAIVCVEPDPQAYGVLARNAAVIENCFPICVALALGMQTQPFFIGKSSHPGRSLMIDAERFVQDLNRQDLDLIKVDTGGTEIPILLSLRNSLAKTAVVLLEFHSDADRRIMDALLCETHILWYSNVTSAHRGSLCYVLRSQAPSDYLPSPLAGEGN